MPYFFSDEIVILSVNLNNINLDDVFFGKEQLKTINYVRLMTWCNRSEQRKAFTKDISKELMPVA